MTVQVQTNVGTYRSETVDLVRWDLSDIALQQVRQLAERYGQEVTITPFVMYGGKDHLSALTIKSSEGVTLVTRQIDLGYLIGWLSGRPFVVGTEW